MAEIMSVSEKYMQLHDVVLAPKAFSTGSKGWFWGGKLTDDNGNVYQCNLQAVVPHSKDDPTMPTPTSDLSIGDVALPAKAFSTGSKGYFVNGRVLTGQGSVQLQLQAVLVGSKPVSPERIEKAEASLAKLEAQVAAKRAAVEGLKGAAGREAFDKLT